MRRDKVRWRVSQRDIDRLSRTARPIRSYREVAEQLGISIALVAQLEASALAKIIRAMHDLEENTNTTNEKIIGTSNYE